MNTILLDLLAFGSVLSGINFIGITYLIIYVGAIAILFLFVVMMINVKLVEIHQSTIHSNQHLPLALMIGTAFFMTFNQITEMYGLHLDRTELIFGNVFTIGRFLPPDNSFIQFSQVESLGNLIDDWANYSNT
ncbi:NADH dehydrogenase subunit 6 [Jimgerdemannia flammicorona]|uniref:NADH dehydrogenase subunit 6 n=2 Tax=Jimgerdemannia flammicorona TaxID=994334 RepID=A0A433QC22_9FUNG|nr:NADH dehydrogenase subunit 6 [Jimgerdemannia flammicorona]RUS27356.1 NADH dehydrogenase subunit 6 [Jimgerdemannia flammicorona]